MNKIVLFTSRRADMTDIYYYVKHNTTLLFLIFQASSLPCLCVHDSNKPQPISHDEDRYFDHTMQVIIIKLDNLRNWANIHFKLVQKLRTFCLLCRT